jgi:lycopene cyclase domain-containing protein
LESKYLYLSINLLSVAVPFLFSFYPKANFSKKWRYVLPAIAISGLFFIIWDIVFTRLGVWGFNPKYLTGIHVLWLPLEEVLFFFCIPYACIFTYFALNHLIEKDHLFPHQELITSVLIFLLLILGGYFMSNLYTGVTFMTTALFLALIMLKLRTRFMGRFYLAFGVILLPFLIVNGILTGSFIDEPVVWYNNEENLGIRLGTIPVEDVIYGMLMLLIPITIAEKWEEYDYYKK